MRAALILLLAAGICRAQEFKAGTETRIDWDGLAHPLIVSVPSNYDPEIPAPSIFYYHGTNGLPNLGPLPAHTKGKDFVLIGMTYLKRGNLNGSTENLKAEFDQLFAVREQLSKKLNLNPNRTFIAGFSKGGWTSSFLAEFGLGKLRGAMIMGAGVTSRAEDRRPDEAKRRPPNAFPIYVGVGQWDGNYLHGLRCIRHFSEIGCEVTFDGFPGVSHNLPRRSEYMSQWLALQAAGTKEKEDALATAWWLKLRARLGKESAFNRYLILTNASRAPFQKRLSAAAKAEMQERLTAAKADPSLAAELPVEAKYLTVLSEELSDPTTPGLMAAMVKYREVYKSSPETHFGKEAHMQWQRCHLLASNSVARPLPGVSDLPEFRKFAASVKASKPDAKTAAEIQGYFRGVNALLNGRH